MSSGYFDKSYTNCSSASATSASSASGATRTLPPKKRRFVHCTDDLNPSMDCFDHYAFSTFSPPKRVRMPTIEAVAAANTNEVFAQHIADALSSLFENCRSAMESADLQCRCTKAPSQVISASSRYRSNNAGSGKQQYQTLDHSVVFALSDTLAQEQLQSSQAVAISSPNVAVKVALWNVYLKARSHC